MPGTFIIRPIEANLTHNTDLLSKMNPYCALKVGGSSFTGQVCKSGGKHPVWNDSITIPATNEQTAIVELMDKDRITKDDSIGGFMLNLQEVASQGQVSKWYPLSHKNKPAGEILLECIYQPQGGLTGGQFGSQLGSQQGLYANQGQFSSQQGQYGAGLNQFSTQSQTVGLGQFGGQSQSASFHSEQNYSNISHGSHAFVEQRQVVEPHTFMKNVEVTETVPCLKQIEVMEPRRVLKDVLVTEAVPVTKQIETTEPQVVTKEIEVMEPRLVTKEIKVIENVPVMRQVEVIEPRTSIKEVHTFEPQTFTRQVEVTENVPVLQTVTVTEPVTLRKAVEFVEPVITTKTITKELQQPVIVDEKITTTVGPATLVGYQTELRERFGEMRISEEQRIQQRVLEEQRILEQERIIEQERLRNLGGQAGGYSSTSTYQTNPELGLGGTKKTEYSSTTYTTSHKPY